MFKNIWTAEEKQFLKDNYGKMPLGEIARALNRTRPSIAGKAGKLGLRRKKEPRWTEAEIKYLRDNWGKCSPETLARRMGRSVNAIDVKSKRLKLGPVQDKSCFTKTEICKLLGVDHRKIDFWIETGLLKAKIAPTTSKSSKRRNILQVKPGELEQFLKEHPEQWDSRRAEDIIKALRVKELEEDKFKVQRREGKQIRRIPEHLRSVFVKFVIETAKVYSDRIREAKREPDWLKKKKEQDINKKYPREELRWTPEEDAKLRLMFKSGNFTHKQIGERLGRSEAAVGHRLARIVIWDQPRKKEA